MATFNPLKFLREVRQEAGRVTWPSRRETTVSTIMVLVLVVIASIFFLVTDATIAFAVEWVLGMSK